MKIFSKFSLKMSGWLAILGAFLANYPLAANATQPNSLERLKKMAQLTGYSTAEVKPQIVVVEIITYLLGFVGR